MGSVPLLALAGRGESDGGAQGIRNALGVQLYRQNAALAPGQQQIQQQTIEDNQQKLNDQQAMTAAMQQWDGKDPNELPGLILKNHGSAQAVFGTKNQILSQQKMLNEADDATLTNLAKKNDIQLGKLNTLQGLPDDQLPQAVQALAQDGLQNKYLDPPHAQGLLRLAQQGPNAIKAQLPILEKQLQGGATQFANQIKDRETAAKEQEAQAAQQKAQNEAARLAAEGPGGALQPVEQKELSDWLKKNPNKGPADFLAYKASIVPKLNFNLNASAGGGLTDPALDQAAQRYLTTGQLPPAGRGPAAMMQNRKIMNRAAEMDPTGSITGNSAIYKSNQESLSKLQTNFDQVTAFENTAGKNLDVFLNQAKKVVDSGSPWINRPLRAVAANSLGSEDQAAFNAARTTALTEIAKVLNSSNASGVLSDSARSEVEQLIGPGATLKQIVKAAGVLQQDMGNRKQSYLDQIADIQGRLSKSQGVSAPAATSGTAPQSATAQKFSVGQTVNVRGKTMKITAVHPDGTFDAQ